MTDTWAAPETVGATNGRSRYCLTCRTISGDERPPDWLWVTVNDASEPRGFRPFGLFCSTECLAAKLPEVARLLAQIDAIRAEQAQSEPVEATADMPVRFQPIVNDTARELLALSEIVGHLEALPRPVQQRCARYLADRYAAAAEA